MSTETGPSATAPADAAPAAAGAHPDLAHALLQRLLTIYAIAASSTIGVGAVLFLTGLDLNLHQVWLLMGVAAVTLVPTFVADLAAIRWSLRPIARALELPPAEVTPDLAWRALVRALNLPVWAGARVLVVHLPTFMVSSTLLCLGANEVLYLDLSGDQLELMWLECLLIGTGHALYEFLAVGAAAAPTIAVLRDLAPAPAAGRHERLVVIGMERKLLVVSAFAAASPLLVLGTTTLLKAEHLLVRVVDPSLVQPALAPAAVASGVRDLTLWVVVVVVAASLVATFMVRVLARDVARSVATLAAAMKAVGQGQLGQRLVVASTDEFAELYDGFNHMTNGLQERERLRDAFGRFVAPEVADEVMRRGVVLGGDVVPASILFADIRGFTTLSERLAPAEVVRLLNAYFAAVEPALDKEGGWINKFGGDSMLCVFGAPVSQPDHAACAVRAALHIRVALRGFNEAQKARGDPEIAIGMGVHCGELIAGNVGSPTRMEYTVIGDVVNAAARLQAMTKEADTDLLLSGDVYRASGLTLPVRPLPPTVVRGKTEAMEILAVPRDPEAPAPVVAVAPTGRKPQFAQSGWLNKTPE